MEKKESSFLFRFNAKTCQFICDNEGVWIYPLVAGIAETDAAEIKIEYSELCDIQSVINLARTLKDKERGNDETV